MTIDQVRALKPDDRKALHVFLSHLHSELGPRLRRVVLYGSKARGTSRPDSDIDVLVIVDREDRKARKVVAQAAYRATVASRAFIAAQTASARFWNRSRRLDTFFSRNVERDGVELNA